MNWHLDTIHWKYVAFFDYSPNWQTLIKYDMQEKINRYHYNCDTKKTLAVFNKSDTLHKNTFTYYRSANGDLQLKGAWFGKRTAMELKNMPIDSMTLVKDKFLFIQGN